MVSKTRKLEQELAAMVERLGFTLLAVERSRNDHLCCFIRDDAGNKFKVFTGITCSSYDRAARLNFKQDVRKASNRAKGLCD